MNSGLTGEYDFPNVVHLGGTCFSECKNLISVKCDNLYDIGNLVFGYCTSLKEVVLGSGTANMGARFIEGCTSLQSLTILAETPPELVKSSYYEPYSFGEGMPEGFRIILSETASVDAYIDRWKCWIMGYEEGDVMSAEEELEATNKLRVLFGLEKLTEETDQTEEPEPSEEPNRTEESEPSEEPNQTEESENSEEPKEPETSETPEEAEESETLETPEKTEESENEEQETVTEQEEIQEQTQEVIVEQEQPEETAQSKEEKSE